MITGEYPLFGENQDPTDDTKASYRTAMIYNVKCTRDLDQTITVPSFVGYEKISMIRLITVGWYFVTGVTTSTMHNETITFNIHYCASSSNISKGQSVKGYWSRRPTPDPGIHQSVSNKPIFSYSQIEFPTMTAYAYSKTHESKVYWVQISSTNYIDSSGVTHTDHYCRYGLFATDNSLSSTSTVQGIGYKEGDGSNTYYQYPGIDDIINNIDQYLGIESSSITDISVIPICPYQYAAKSGDKFAWICLTDSSGNDILPTVGKDIQITTVLGAKLTFSLRCYNLTPDYLIDSVIFSSVSTPIERPDDVYNYPLPGYDFAVNCTFSLKDWMGNILCDVPCSENILIKMSYICDTTGIYTIVTNNETGLHQIMTSAKLPYVGSQWEAYKAYSMDTDRKAIQFAQEQYERQWQMNAINGVANGLIGAGIGAASGGTAGILGAGISAVGSVATSAVSSALGRDLNNLKLSQDQELTESRIRASPGTAYATAYGKNQIELMNKFKAGIYVNQPVDYGTDVFADTVKEKGYPTQGVQTLAISVGYYKGRILSADGVTGVIFNRLNEEFNSGLKFKEF